MDMNCTLVKSLIKRYESDNYFVDLLSQELGLSSLDVMLLMYGHAMALTEIGLPEVIITTQLNPFNQYFFQDSPDQNSEST